MLFTQRFVECVAALHFLSASPKNPGQDTAELSGSPILELSQALSSQCIKLRKCYKACQILNLPTRWSTLFAAGARMHGQHGMTQYMYDPRGERSDGHTKVHIKNVDFAWLLLVHGNSECFSAALIMFQLSSLGSPGAVAPISGTTSLRMWTSCRRFDTDTGPPWGTAPAFRPKKKNVLWT